MAWSWSFVPKRLLRDPRFLRLEDDAAGLLLRLYAAADRWGRGPMDADAFAVVAGALRGVPDFEERVNRLVESGLVLVSVDGTSWQLDRYDEDAPRDVLRGRPSSEYAEGRPGQYLSLPEKSAARRAAPPDAGKIRAAPPDAAPGGTVRSCAREGRQAGRQVAPSLRSELPEAAPPRAPASRPIPSGSTDARAIGRPAEVSPPPALGGAGGDTPEIWDDPVPAAVPPVVCTLESLCKRGHIYVDEARNGRCPKCEAGEPPPPPRSEHRRGFVPPPRYAFEALALPPGRPS